MKSNVFLFMTLLALFAASCNEPDSVQNEAELYTSDGGQTSPQGGKD